MQSQVHITRKELTGRLRRVADRMQRYRGPLTVTVPDTTMRAWEMEIRRIEAQIHALPDMQMNYLPGKEWYREPSHHGGQG